MTGPQLPDVDHGLHDALEKLTRQHGATDLDWLAVRARKELRDARIDSDTIAAVVDLSTMLVWRPDDTVDHLLNVLDGVVLTQRVRAPLAGREDLWCTVAMQPLLNITAFTSLPLADGTGHVRRAASGQDVLVGPAGWLPDVPRYGLVGLRLQGGRLSAAPVDEDDLPDLTEQEQVRQLLAHHYRLERWYGGDDHLQTRPAEMVRALQYARLEDPKLLSVPHPPLDELLYLSLDQDSGKHYWRDWAAFAEGTVSLAITGLPEALYVELDRRAKRYGMSLDQFVIAVLGHLAWRTPFAEDMGPWDDWNPDHTSATVRRLSIAE